MRFAPLPTLALLDIRLTARDLTVMAAITTHGDKAGYCWPSQGRLARGLGISRQAVGKSITSLKDAGWIETVRRRREDGGWMSDAIRVLFDFQPAAQYLRSFGNQQQLDFNRPLQPDVAGGVQPQVAGGQPEVSGPCNSTLHPPATTGCTELTHEGTTHPPACACAREGELPEGHELFVAFATGPRPDDLLTYCTADVPNLRETFAELTEAQVKAVLREIGAWYRDECRDPDNPHGRKARLPHDWKRMVRKWMGEARDKAVAGKSPTKGAGMTENFEGKHYEGDDDAERFFAAQG